ncbi:MAG: rhamnogalacturonan acetylesterase [Bacteroidales bacterium]|nr:rhamnogalacturonan acetylesterase [Bacteroidales bacterium]
MKKSLFSFFTFFILFTCGAQIRDANGINDTTVDNYKPTEDVDSKYARPVPGSSRKGNNPVLFLVGNSTMRTGTKGNGNNGQWGWGAFAAQYFDEERITVENHALGGTSSRTFYNQLWPDVLKGVQAGDYVLIELGHNDNGPLDTWTARNSIAGIDPDTCATVTLHDCRSKDWNGRVETVYSYGQYMRMFINDVRAKGAYPLIASLTPRNSWDNETTITRKWTTFTPWGKAVAEEMNVPWIDLEGVSASRLEKFGHWKTDYMFYYVDKIHTSRFGAENNAYSAALAIQQCENCPLKEYLKDLTPIHVDVNRVPGKTVVWLCGDSTCKNSDNDPNGMWGWGSQAYTVFDTAAVIFRNEAMAGRSCRTYLNERRWEKVYNSLQPGDIVFLQFGHNDVGDIEKGKARGEIALGTDSTKVFKLETTGEYEAVYSFGWYLKKMIGDAREKGAIPILLSLTPRNEWPDGKVERRNDTYGRWYRQVVEATGVPFIDVHNITADFLDSIGQEAARAYYNHDHTHTSLLGAQRNARSVAQGMRSLGYDRLLK